MHTRIPEVLLVDDCKEDIELMKQALSDNDFNAKLDIAYNGEEALRRLNVAEDEYPDLILLDLNMPRINGHQLLEKIKTHETLKRIPVIIMTTSRSPDDIDKCYSNHSNCYVCKPIDFESYQGVIGEIKRFWFEIVKLPTQPRRFT